MRIAYFDTRHYESNEMLVFVTGRRCVRLISFNYHHIVNVLQPDRVQIHVFAFVLFPRHVKTNTLRGTFSNQSPLSVPAPFCVNQYACYLLFTAIRMPVFFFFTVIRTCKRQHFLWRYVVLVTEFTIPRPFTQINTHFLTSVRRKDANVSALWRRRTRRTQILTADA